MTDPLWRRLVPDIADPGYERAAARRGGAPASGPAQAAALVAGALLVGLVLGVAASDATARAPGDDQTRRSLVQDVEQARDAVDDLTASAADVAARVQSAQERALAGSSQGAASLDAVRELEVAAGAIEVSGPGLRITVADGPDGAVLDRDLQVLVNGMWAAGAEAVAVGGVRLHPRATVRQAGEAVLVDNRPVAQPYVVEAIGDPSGLQVRLVDTDAYGRFRTLSQVYGITFTIEPAESLRLAPGAPPEPSLARKEGGR